ncbi:MAG TPA: hypothetical protein PKI61_02760 [bacterium]|nr:hypothetical protein [bacterium]HPT29832.1 hypothetical protein [bacterium]
MSKKNKKLAAKEASLNPEKMAWQIKDYEHRGHNKKWYLIAGAVGIALIVYAIFTHNYLFGLLIVMAGTLVYFLDQQEPLIIDFSVSGSGIHFGPRLIPYERLKDFAVVFRPDDNIKTLYLNYKNTARRRLSIPLNGTDPLILRRFLLKYLNEDLDRTDAPLSEGIAKMLKL